MNDLLCVRDVWSGLRFTAIVFLAVYAPFGIITGLTVN
jgi:hypothetical protein